MTMREPSSTSASTPTSMPETDDKGRAKSTSTIVTAEPISSPGTPTRTDSTKADYPYTRNLWLARLLRFLGPIGFFWHTWFLSPRGIRASSTERVKTRDGHEITIHIYRPRSEGTRRPCIVNFHGGGWTIGYPTDDARWARWCVQKLDAVFISVDYRLAPEHPWPISVQDCIDATRYIYQHADRLGIDREKIVTSGFSAGGSLAVTTAIALAHPAIDPPSAALRSKDLRLQPIHLKGIVSFYPLLDFSTSRPEKITRAKRPEILRPLPTWMTRMFDTSYLPPPSEEEGRPVIDRTHPLISPLLAPDELLVDFPHIHLCLCERDVLGQEGQDMADRLNTDTRKSEVVCRWVKGAGHGWDKPPHAVTQSVKDEYDEAVASVKRWCA